MNKNATNNHMTETNKLRRAHDNISNKKTVRRLNLDRRLFQRERRMSESFTYKGVPRRYTIDRRVTLGDRRTEK